MHVEAFYNFPHIKVTLKNLFGMILSSCQVDGHYEVYCIDTRSLQTVSRDLNSCSCCLRVNVGVPCSHIFAVLAYTSDDLFQPDLVANRWLTFTAF